MQTGFIAETTQFESRRGFLGAAAVEFCNFVKGCKGVDGKGLCLGVLDSVDDTTRDQAERLCRLIEFSIKVGRKGPAETSQ